MKNSYRHQILVFITLPAGNNLFWFKWFGRKQQHSTGQDRMNINETYFYVFIGCSSLSAWVFGSCLKIRFIKSVSWLVSIIVVIYSLCFSRLDVKKKHILPYGGFPYTFVFIFLHQYSIFFTLNSFALLYWLQLSSGDDIVLKFCILWNFFINSKNLSPYNLDNIGRGCPTGSRTAKSQKEKRSVNSQDQDSPGWSIFGTLRPGMDLYSQNYFIFNR